MPSRWTLGGLPPCKPGCNSWPYGVRLRAWAHRSWRIPACLLALALAALPSALAWPSDAPAVGNAQAGAAKATLCAACHGPKGISSNPLWPNLAGQQQKYLENRSRSSTIAHAQTFRCNRSWLI